MKNKKITIFLISFFMLLSIGFLAFVFPKIKESEERKPKLPIIGNDQNHHVSPFSFVNQEGKTITNDDVKGKIYIVDYFFATCKGICPKMNENMEKVYKSIKGDKGVMILSHTVDPTKDTIKALKEYSLRFDADPNQWYFLTGDKKALYEMARYSYLISAEDDTTGVSVDEDFIHDKHFALVDKHGRIRGFYDGLADKDVQKLIADIKLLQKEVEPNP
jgi:protein SCO1/2